MLKPSPFRADSLTTHSSQKTQYPLIVVALAHLYHHCCCCGVKLVLSVIVHSPVCFQVWRDSPAFSTVQVMFGTLTPKPKFALHQKKKTASDSLSHSQRSNTAISHSLFMSSRGVSSSLFSSTCLHLKLCAQVWSCYKSSTVNLTDKVTKCTSKAVPLFIWECCFYVLIIHSQFQTNCCSSWKCEKASLPLHPFSVLKKNKQRKFWTSHENCLLPTYYCVISSPC